MSMITSTITSTVTLGTGTYTSPLTIASSGAIFAGVGDGIDSASGGSINNAGIVQSGTNGIQVSGAAGRVTNSGTISATYGVYGAGIMMRGAEIVAASLFERSQCGETGRSRCGCPHPVRHA
jgi:hypothetical protein